MINGSQLAVVAFAHDAGMTPAIDSSGLGTFNIVATAEPLSAEALAQLDVAAGSPEGTGSRQDSPDAVQPPHFDVIVSYN